MIQPSWRTSQLGPRRGRCRRVRYRFVVAYSCSCSGPKQATRQRASQCLPQRESVRRQRAELHACYNTACIHGRYQAALRSRQLHAPLPCLGCTDILGTDKSTNEMMPTDTYHLCCNCYLQLLNLAWSKRHAPVAERVLWRDHHSAL